MKKFKEFLVENKAIDREQVRELLGHDNFKIVDDKINVYKNGVYLERGHLKSIPFPFREIQGSFWCSDNQLTSLENCPEIVEGGDFGCSYNELTSLKNCPKKVEWNFYCSHNQLTSLQYCTKTVGGRFYCENNPLVDISDIIGTNITLLDCDWDKLNITLGNVNALIQTKRADKVDWYIDATSEEELQLHAIKLNPENIHKIPNILDSVIEIIKRDYPELIRYLPYNKQTKLTGYGL